MTMYAYIMNVCFFGVFLMNYHDCNFNFYHKFYLSPHPVSIAPLQLTVAQGLSFMVSGECGMESLLKEI